MITETVFAIPGVGRLMIDSIFARDYAVVQALTMVLAVLVSIVFVAVDAIQACSIPGSTAERGPGHVHGGCPRPRPRVRACGAPDRGRAAPDAGLRLRAAFLDRRPSTPDAFDYMPRC